MVSCLGEVQHDLAVIQIRKQTLQKYMFKFIISMFISHSSEILTRVMIAAIQRSLTEHAEIPQSIQESFRNTRTQKDLFLMLSDD